jgi:hypothetical protein
MAFPEAWPPRPATATRSIRAFKKGTADATFADNAYMFRDLPGANTYKPTPVMAPGDTTAVHFGDYNSGGAPMGGRQVPEDAAVGLNMTPPDGGEAPPHAMLWANTIRVFNDGAAGDGSIEISFDGINVHGELKEGEVFTYRHRHEAGIALRRVLAGKTPAFRIEAW